MCAGSATVALPNVRNSSDINKHWREVHTIHLEHHEQNWTLNIYYAISNNHSHNSITIIIIAMPIMDSKINLWLIIDLSLVKKQHP